MIHIECIIPYVMAYVSSLDLRFYFALLRCGNQSTSFTFMSVGWMLVKKTALQTRGENLLNQLLICGLRRFRFPANDLIPYIG